MSAGDVVAVLTVVAAVLGVPFWAAYNHNDAYNRIFQNLYTFVSITGLCAISFIAGNVSSHMMNLTIGFEWALYAFGAQMALVAYIHLLRHLKAWGFSKDSGPGKREE